MSDSDTRSLAADCTVPPPAYPTKPAFRISNEENVSVSYCDGWSRLECSIYDTESSQFIVFENSHVIRAVIAGLETALESTEEQEESFRRERLDTDILDAAIEREENRLAYESEW